MWDLSLSADALVAYCLAGNCLFTLGMLYQGGPKHFMHGAVSGPHSMAWRTCGKPSPSFSSSRLLSACNASRSRHFAHTYLNCIIVSVLWACMILRGSFACRRKRLEGLCVRPCQTMIEGTVVRHLHEGGSIDIASLELVDPVNFAHKFTCHCAQKQCLLSPQSLASFCCLHLSALAALVVICTHGNRQPRLGTGRCCSCTCTGLDARALAWLACL